MILTEARWQMMNVRAELWDVAVEQHGYFTLDDVRGLGLDETAVRMMARRQKLDHPAMGVWRFPQWPTTQADAYQLAVLWTGACEAALSHETTLLVHDLSDVNPDRTHLTVASHRRIRRRLPGTYEVHHHDLAEQDLGWWEGIRTVRPTVAIQQCITYGTPTYLLRQAVAQARTTGLITERDQQLLNEAMENRDAHV